MKKRILLTLFIIVLGISASLVLWKSMMPATVPKEDVHLTISAAASLKDAMQEVRDLYISQHPHVNIDLNFGSSGQLQLQIEQGAPVDLFISAGKPQMDQLEAKGLIDNSTRTDILGNDLVLVVSINEIKVKDAGDLLKPEVTKVAIGEPKTVPAGKYAQETLNSLGIWNQLEPKLVMASDVKQVLAYVEAGNAEAGFVYSSDAVVAQKVKVAAAMNEKLHSPIVYPAAIIKSSSQEESAREFMDFLYDAAAKSVFAKYGFKPLD